MKNLLNVIIILLITCSSALAQSSEDENSVKFVIDKMFQGMVKGDSSLVHQTLQRKCVLKTVLRKKDGTTVVIDEPVQAFLDHVGKPMNEKIEERLLSYDIKIDADMAMAWTPYQFYIADKLSHCGVNVFMLARQNSEWKIISITDTRRKDCK